MTNQITLAWQKFLNDRNEEELKEQIDNNPIDISINAEYPYFHRLQDISLCGSTYRVNRLFDSETHTEEIIIEETSHPRFDEPGVPGWLTGDKLQKWIIDEVREPAKGPVSWEKYK